MGRGGGGVKRHFIPKDLHLNTVCTDIPTLMVHYSVGYSVFLDTGQLCDTCWLSVTLQGLARWCDNYRYTSHCEK